jgi:hypothetical protein
VLRLSVTDCVSLDGDWRCRPAAHDACQRSRRRYLSGWAPLPTLRNAARSAEVDCGWLVLRRCLI